MLWKVTVYRSCFLCSIRNDVRGPKYPFEHLITKRAGSEVQLIELQRDTSSGGNIYVCAPVM